MTPSPKPIADRLAETLKGDVNQLCRDTKFGGVAVADMNEATLRLLAVWLIQRAANMVADRYAGRYVEKRTGVNKKV